jgi:cellobiose phosphorylase
VAADIYAVPPHIGRGGWTWYTGSAGWMYRLIVETLLGLRLEGNRVSLNPRMPRAWNSLKIHYRHQDTFYHITILRLADDSPDAERLLLDGKEIEGKTFPVVDDRHEHTVELKVKGGSEKRSVLGVDHSP